MRRHLVLAILGLMVLALAFGSLAEAAKRKTGGTTAFVDVSVISMNPDDSKKVRKHQTVIVEKGLISTIGPVAGVLIPDKAETINGKGKLFLLPGLNDMHVHHSGVPTVEENLTPQDIYSIYFANGITTWLDMSGYKKAFDWRKKIRRGRIVGPSLYFTTPIIDEEDHATPEELEADIRKWVEQGYAYLKSHNMPNPERFKLINDLGRELGVPVVAHAMRPGFPIQDTLAEEPLMIAHIEEILSTTDFNGDLTDLQAIKDALEPNLQAVADSRVWVTTTVNTYEIIANTVDDTTFAGLLTRQNMKYIPPSVRSLWELQNRFRLPEFTGDRDFWLFALDVKLHIAQRLKELGSLDRLLVGTDAVGVPLILPGTSTHDELRLLVRAGLTPWEAILAGTYNPAVFFETEAEVGSVEVDKRADLVLVKKNPLKRIGNLKKLSGVMVNGVWLSKQNLDARLEALADKWAS